MFSRITVSTLALLCITAGPVHAQFSVKLWGQNGEQFGRSIADIGDVTGDSVNDFAVGAPAFGPNNNGNVYVYDGSSFGLLYTMTGGAGDQFGWSIAGIGDVNGDGTPDLCVGAPQQGMGNATGYVQGRDGATGALLWTGFLVGNAPLAGGVGFSVASLGAPVWPDTVANAVVVSAPFAYGTRGAILVLRGSNGGPPGVGMFPGTAVGSGPGEFLGYSVDGLGDIDNDTVPDILVGIPGIQRARVYRWSGFSLVNFQTIVDLSVVNYGACVKSAGSIDGDSDFDILIGSNGNQTDLFALAAGTGTPTLLSSFIATPANPGALGVGLGYGTALDAGVDRDNDGFLDLLIGARGRTNPVPSGVDFVSTAFVLPVGMPTATYWNAGGVGVDFGRSVAFVAGSKIGVGAPLDGAGGSVTIYL